MCDPERLITRATFLGGSIVAVIPTVCGVACALAEFDPAGLDAILRLPVYEDK
jgi:hypothetical protein